MRPADQPDPHDSTRPEPVAGSAESPASGGEDPAGVREIIEEAIETTQDPSAAGAAEAAAPREPAAADLLDAGPDAGDEEASSDTPDAVPEPAESAAEAAAASGEGGAEADEAHPQAQPSTREGMGAVPYEAGVTFRVWAPNADAVSVAGPFNGWNADATPLAREAGGTWSADVEGAKAGDEYKLVVRNGDRAFWRRDPYSRDVSDTSRNSVVVDPAFAWGDDSGYRTPSWNELVIYELHVGTFNDEPGNAPGTFDTVIARLPYLRDLGVSCIELMPSVEFLGDYSWGYNPADIFAIESIYGGPAKLKELVKAAHAHGIAVVFDVVYNHFGPDELDLWQFDGWSPAPDRGGIYFYGDERSATPWGHTRPDYGREEVRRFIADNARMWLEEFHMDGLRWDATAYVRNRHGNDDSPATDIPDGWGLMQRVTDDTDARQPWKLHIAEDLRGNGWITRPPADGGAGFDAQWDGEFVHPVRRAVIGDRDDSRSMEEVARAIAHRYEGDPLRRVIYTESHDEVANGHARVPEEIWPGNAGSWYSRKRSTLGAALVFTSPGIPMVFQGQEILEDRWFADGDPVDWTKLQTHAGIHRLYRDLARLRRNWHDHTRGLRGPHVRVHHVNDQDKVIAFHRWESGGPRDDVVVVANFAERAYPAYEVGFPRGGEWKVRFNGDARVYGDDFGGQDSFDTRADGPPLHGMPHSASAGIGPYTVVILSQDG